MLAFPIYGTFSNRNNNNNNNIFNKDHAANPKIIKRHNDAIGEISYMIARGIYRGYISDKNNFAYEAIPQHEIPNGIKCSQLISTTRVQGGVSSVSSHSNEIVNKPYYCLYKGKRMPPFTYSGRLHLIVGPMYSGKTSEMERCARRERIAGREVIIIKPSLDTRFQTNEEVISHDNVRIPAKACNLLSDVMDDLLKSDVVCIDEGQFIPDLLEVCDLLCNIGKIVIIAMLHATYERTPFPKGNPMRLFSMADNIQFLTSICVVCGMEASNSYILMENNNDNEVNKDDDEKAPKSDKEDDYPSSSSSLSSSCIIIEGDGKKQAKYQPRCRRCFME